MTAAPGAAVILLLLKKEAQPLFEEGDQDGSGPQSGFSARGPKEEPGWIRRCGGLLGRGMDRRSKRAERFPIWT